VNREWDLVGMLKRVLAPEESAVTTGATSPVTFCPANVIATGVEKNKPVLGASTGLV
jgi:hypothetical protein